MRKKELHEIQWFDCKLESVTTELKDGKSETQYIISGPFMRADVPNRNNRVYPREEANKAIAKLRPMVAEKRIRMLVDHPDFFSGSSLIRTGAILLEVGDVEADGYAYYKGKIVDTVVGKDLKVILDAGSKVGVSTRGYGNSKEEAIPGYDGKYNVIYDWELSSIDFVDDPAVIDTEAYMHMESKKRSNGMFKNVEELKTACPELVQSIVDSSIDSVKTEYEAKLKEAEEKIKESAQLKDEKATEMEALVEQIKKVFPDKFTVVEESAIVTEKEKALSEISKTLEDSKVEINTLRKQIKDMEDSHVKTERDSFIEHLQASDPDFFKFESFKDCFENCLTKEEVKIVYDSNSKIVNELKEKVGTPAPAKAQQTEETTEPVKEGLSDEQRKNFEARNLQRLRSGLTPWTEASYIEKFGTKA